MRDPRAAGRAAAVVCLLLSCLAFACAPAPVDNTDEARAGIAATNRRFMDLVEQKDAAGVAMLYTEDAKLLAPGAPPIEGRAAIEQAFAGMLQGIARVQLDTVEVEGHGDTAHEQEALTFFDAGGAQIDEGKAIVIWKKVGEEWKLHRDIFNSNLPPTAAAPAAEVEGDPEAPAADGTAAVPPA